MNDIIFYSHIQKAINNVRELKKGFLTNFYPNVEKISLWLNRGLLSMEVYRDSVYFLKQNDEFYNLYFCTTDIHSLDELLKHLQSIKRGRLFISDLIGNETHIQSIVQTFKGNDFFLYTSLKRMSRLAATQEKEERIGNIKLAKPNQVIEVKNLLYRYFDPFAEQLPLIEEIGQWISVGHLITYEENSEIIGFVIYDLIGITSYLRYWFVHPEHRNKKIGSSLLRNFFVNSNNTKRQLFWVIQSNNNAIKRYISYGFAPENMVDYVMINENIQYERKSN